MVQRSPSRPQASTDVENPSTGESTPSETPSAEDAPLVIRMFRREDSLLEHTYGEGLHALLKNRPPEAVYAAGGDETAQIPVEASIHRPNEKDHMFVVLETDDHGQSAFSGTFGDVVTALLHLYQSDVTLEAITTPAELPDFDG